MLYYLELLRVLWTKYYLVHMEDHLYCRLEMMALGKPISNEEKNSNATSEVVECEKCSPCCLQKWAVLTTSDVSNLPSSSPRYCFIKTQICNSYPNSFPDPNFLSNTHILPTGLNGSLSCYALGCSEDSHSGAAYRLTFRGCNQPNIISDNFKTELSMILTHGRCFGLMSKIIRGKFQAFGGILLHSLCLGSE